MKFNPLIALSVMLLLSRRGAWGKGRRRDKDDSVEGKTGVIGEDDIDPDEEPFYGYYPESKKIIAMTLVRTFGPNHTIDHNGVNGTVYFQQLGPGGPTWVNGTLHGLRPGKHGIAVMSLGDLSNGCNPKGVEHFNPLPDKTHGGVMSTERHCGDLGNVEAQANGTATFEFKAYLLLRLLGKNGIVGRLFAVSEHEDDQGRCELNDTCAANDTALNQSPTDGNMGRHVGCGVIGIVGDYSLLEDHSSGTGGQIYWGGGWFGKKWGWPLHMLLGLGVVVRNCFEWAR